MEKRLVKRTVDASVILLFIVLGFLFIGKYFGDSFGALRSGIRSVGNMGAVAANVAGLFDSCGEDASAEAISLRAYVCDEHSYTTEFPEIYFSYPASADGKEIVYAFLDKGDPEQARLLMENTYDFGRDYQPVYMEGLPTWQENPYNRYWRFIFYSLRPTRHLLARAVETGEERYFQKTRELVESWLRDGQGSDFSWDDSHGLAFRTMTLVNTWWKLRQHSELPEDLSDNILSSLIRHGDSLMEPGNYEPGNNHGVTQATALLVLAVNFPDLPGASDWEETAKRRLEDGLATILDEDGVLSENSPYYHLYSLEKYWEINRYLQKHDVEIGGDFEERIEDMTMYATHIIRPDGSVPLLGASIPRKISLAGEFREIADSDKQFAYSITQGAKGSVPKETVHIFSSSGQAVARSGWGKERPFTEEGHLVFDAGPFRTDHSDFDALNIDFFAKGLSIIRDTGLYTYTEEDRYFDYFHGTRGHNTVMVDGENQPAGTGRDLKHSAGEGYVYFTAEHDLYGDVVHIRGVVMVENDTLVVFDRINSVSAPAETQTHVFELLFHLAPEAVVRESDEEGLELFAETDSGIRIRLKQLLDFQDTTMEIFVGDTEVPRGICATAYEQLAPCPEISFRSEGAEAQFLTLITGAHSSEGEPEVLLNEPSRKIQVRTQDRTYSIPFPDWF